MKLEKKKRKIGASHTAGLEVVQPPPCPSEWSGHLQKAKKTKKQKKKRKKKKEKCVKMGFGLLGVVRAWDGFSHPILAVGDGRSHPQKPKTHFNLFFFFFCLLGWPDYPLRHRTTPRSAVGVARAPLIFIFFFKIKNKKLMAKTTSFWVGCVL
jgi:hypothetical protein